MNKLIPPTALLLVFVLILSCFSLYAQTPPPAAPVQGTAPVQGSPSASPPSPGSPPVSSFKGREPEAGDWVLVALPLLFCITTLLILRGKLKGFDIRDTLQETEFDKKTITNPQYTLAALQSLSGVATLPAALPPTIEISQTEKPKSSSRFIALLTTAIAWSVSVAIACFYIYMYILTGTAPDVGKLATVMLTLGIGVVPYAFNKVSDAVKK